MPLHPGYDPVAQVASELGARGAPAAAVFNAGIFLTGVALLAAGEGFRRTLPRAGASRPLAWAVAGGLTWAALSAIWAALHPLPSRLHDPPGLSAGPFALPVLLTPALWRAPGLRLYLLLNAGLYLLGLAAATAGPGEPGAPGLTQRALALLVFPPLDAAAAWLRFGPSAAGPAAEG